MSVDDFAFAVRLTDTMNWNLVEEDFQFMTDLEPEGCFIIWDESERIGVATTISYGKVGWLGNVIVREEYRGRGVGSLLVKHALDFLIKQDVETIGLYAYQNKIPFYQRLGLEYDSDFIVLRGKPDSSSEQVHQREASKNDERKIIDLDHFCFGASRRKLLAPILSESSNICYVDKEKGLIRGFVVAKVYHEMAEVGPLVCQRGYPDIAIDLLKAALNRVKGLEVVTCIPEKETIIRSTLMKQGFSEAFRVVRMFYGVPRLNDCIYMAESLERG
ncbi:MAG: GNAT family N-acetyltransferase [Candidatus Bathyarchaeota archaeon]|nr:GNAT family N-acetyltransferase [Candidatus Bathyarchaeota archaeon]